MDLERMGENLYKGDDLMSKKENIDAKIQSEQDNLKEALNSISGFKRTMSSGTHGPGASVGRNQR